MATVMSYKIDRAEKTDRLKERESFLKLACEQVILLNDQIRALTIRYNRAKADGYRSFGYNLRVRLAVVEGVRNMFYEYARDRAEDVADLRRDLYNQHVTVIGDSSFDDEDDDDYYDDDDDDYSNGEDDEERDVLYTESEYDDDEMDSDVNFCDDVTYHNNANDVTGDDSVADTDDVHDISDIIDAVLSDWFCDDVGDEVNDQLGALVASDDDSGVDA